MDTEFDPLTSLNNFFRNWWKIALVAVLGGLLGLAVSLLQPPLFQAEAVFYASIDFTEINFENLVTEDGKPYQFTQYDEDLALEVVATVLLAKLNDAYEHALSLDPQMDYDTFLKNMQIMRNHGQWFLRYRHSDPAVAREVVNYWAAAGMAAIEAAQADETIETYVLVDLVALAEFASRADYRNRGVLVLAGTVIGFSAGILFVDSRKRFTAGPSGEVQ
jgi:uncharacterized protein involved in exopolysaccharide biosynthesis